MTPESPEPRPDPDEAVKSEAAGVGPTDDQATIGLSRPDEINWSDTRGASSGDSGDSSKRKPPEVAGYEIIEVLGRGGMGVVYKARDLRLKRTVALKMILIGEHAGDEHLRRFRSEAETIARLQHSNIVQIYDVGERDGHPFLSLEFVDGVDLAKFSAESPQPARLAAELLEAMAHAMQYAHQQGVVHRDLKPGNVLLGKSAHQPADEEKGAEKSGGQWPSRTRKASSDADAHESSSPLVPEQSSLHSQSSPPSRTRSPSTISNVDGQLATSTGLIPKITDFGLAKQLDSDAEFTTTGQILGTALYMAPEQADGSKEIGSWTDIYAMGAILYKLLTGHPPFQGTTLLDTLRMVRLAEPVPPTRFQPRLSKDLETICLTCLQKDPARRYATAGELADELRRFLNDEPILARPVSRFEKLLRLCRRNPVVASLISACAMLLVVGLVLVSWKWREAANAHQVISQQLNQVNQAVEVAVTAEALARQQRDLSLQREAELTFQEGLRLAERGEISRGCLWMVRSLQILKNSRSQEPLDPALADKNINWERMIRVNLFSWMQWTPEIIRAHSEDVPLAPDAFLRGQNKTITRGAISPDGSSYLISDAAGRVSLFETGTGRKIAMPSPIQLDLGAVALTFSPDGKTIAVGLSRDAINAKNPLYATKPTPVRLYDLETGEQIGGDLPHQDHVMQVRFSPDGSTLLTESEKQLRNWEVATGRMLHELTLNTNVRGLQFSPAGDLFLVRTNESEAVYATRSFEPVYPANTTSIRRPLEFTPDGQSILIAEDSYENESILQLHDLSGAPQDVRIRNFFGFENRFRDDWAFTPDGQTLLGVCGDDSMRMWDVETGRLAGAPIRFSKWNELFEASADGRLVITEKWLVRTPRPGSRPSLILDQAAVEGTPGLYFSLGRGPSTVAYPAPFDLSRRGSRTVLTRPYGVDNSTTVTALKDARDGQPIGPPLPHFGNHIRAVALSPDGSLAATAEHVQTVVGGSVNIWNAETGERVWGPLPHTNWVPVLAFSPDNQLLAAGDYHGRVRLWDTRSGKEAAAPLENQEIVFSLDFDSPGTRLAVGTTADRHNSPHCRVWDVSSGRPLSPRLPHGDWVHWVRFSPDGRRLLTATDRGTRLWDGETYAQIGDLVPTEKPLLHLVWRPDSTMFSTCTEEGRVFLHDGDTGQVIGTMSHPRAIHCMAFSLDGALLATGADDGSTRLWDVATQQPLGAPFVQVSAIHGVAFAADGLHVVSTTHEGTTRVWPIPQPVKGDAQHVAQRVELWTGLHWEENRSLSNLTPQQWQQLKQRCDSLFPQDPLAAADSIANWHHGRAADAEQDRNGFAAAWHLTRLIETDSDNWTLRVRLARALMWQGDYTAAAAAIPTPTSQEQFTKLRNWQLHDLAYESLQGKKEHVQFLQKQIERTRAPFPSE